MKWKDAEDGKAYRVFTETYYDGICLRRSKKRDTRGISGRLAGICLDERTLFPAVFAKPDARCEPLDDSSPVDGPSNLESLHGPGAVPSVYLVLHDLLQRELHITKESSELDRDLVRRLAEREAVRLSNMLTVLRGIL